MVCIHEWHVAIFLFVSDWDMVTPFPFGLYGNMYGLEFVYYSFFKTLYVVVYLNSKAEHSA